jgi:hypothetical protein
MMIYIVNKFNSILYSSCFLSFHYNPLQCPYFIVANTGEKQLKGGKTYSGSVSEVSVQCQVDPLLWV